MTLPRLPPRLALLRSLLVAGLLAQLLAHDPAAAQPAGPGPARPASREIVLRLAREVVIPRTETFAATAREQSERWRAFCTSPRPAGLPQLEAAFQASADSWSGLELVRFGPIADDLRFERVAHWPERSNAVGKAVAGLLAGTDELGPERLGRASVAGQGLSALERLLYGDVPDGREAARRALLERSAAGRRRCALGLAISASLARIGQDTVAGWTGPGALLARLTESGPDEAREALTRLVTDHLAALHAIAEAKLGAVLGRNPDGARPLAAEGWRSGRSTRAIRLNLEAAARFSRTALAHDRDALDSVLAGLETPLSVAAELAAGSASLGELAADPARRSQVVLLRDAATSARELSGPAFVKALDITLGFNSQDGD